MVPPLLRTCGARGLYGDLPSGRVRMRVGCDGERPSEGVDGAIELREGVEQLFTASTVIFSVAA